MNYLNRYRLLLEAYDNRTIFELTGSFNELCNNYVNAEEWLCSEFSDCFKKSLDQDTGMIKYSTPYQCNDRPTLRFIGKKEFKDKDGNIKYFDYQIGAKILNFDHEVK